MRQTEKFAAGFYMELRTSEVPHGWTNHPASLGVNIYFTDKNGSIKTMLKTYYNIPDARPILLDTMFLFLLDGGDGKYYLYNDISGDLARVEEPDLQTILAKLGSEGLSSIKYTLLTEE